MRVHSLIVHCVFLVCAVPLLSGCCRKPVPFSITDLGSLGDSGSIHAVNNLGQVLGYRAGDEMPRVDFMWKSGIETKPIVAPHLGRLRLGQINDAGTIKLSIRSEADDRWVQYIWSNGTLTKLTGLTWYQHLCQDGRILGRIEHPDGSRTHAIYDPRSGSITNLAALDGHAAWARAMNSSNLVIGGHILDYQNTSHAVAWVNNEPQTLSLNPGFKDEMTSFLEVNEQGLVLGWTGAEWAVQPFLWTPDDGVVDIEFAPETNPANVRYRMNNRGDVIGSHEVRASPYRGGPSPTVSWIYADGQLIILDELIDPESGWKIDRVTDLNDRRQIVGNGTLNGKRRGFLLQVPDPLDPIVQNEQ